MPKRIFSFATDKELDAGLEWHFSIIKHLDSEANPKKFTGENERINYFGTNLPEKLDSLNVVEAFNAWMMSKKIGAPGCDFLQTLWESLRDLDHINNEKLWRINNVRR